MTVLEGTTDGEFKGSLKDSEMGGWHRALDGTEVTTTGDKLADKEMVIGGQQASENMTAESRE